MRLTQFVYAILERFAPMDDKSSVELRNDAMSWYAKIEAENEQRDAIIRANTELDIRYNSGDLTESEKESLISRIQEVPREKLANKVVKHAENWVVRTMFAIAFIWIVPKIQEYLNPPKPSDRDLDDYEDYED